MEDNRELREPSSSCYEQARARARFDETVDVRFALGTNPKRGDQMVRGALGLPHGTGKEPRICVFASGIEAADARAAGQMHLHCLHADQLGVSLASDLIMHTKVSAALTIEICSTAACAFRSAKPSVLLRSPNCRLK